MFLTALYIHFGQVFRSTVDSSCTALRQYEYTPEGVCTLKEEFRFNRWRRYRGRRPAGPAGGGATLRVLTDTLVLTVSKFVFNNESQGNLCQTACKETLAGTLKEMFYLLIQREIN